VFPKLLPDSMDNNIVFPNGIEEIRTTQEDFFNVAAFPRVLGTIDGTHIRIQSPGNKSLLLTYQRFSELLICNLGGNDAEVFRNRKQYFSINTQMICNSKLKIFNVVARWPESVHDATILRHSNIQNDFANNLYPNCLLLGKL
jgi:hypothetical protein